MVEVHGAKTIVVREGFSSALVLLLVAVQTTQPEMKQPHQLSLFHWRMPIVLGRNFVRVTRNELRLKEPALDPQTTPETLPKPWEPDPNLDTDMHHVTRLAQREWSTRLTQQTRDTVLV